MAKQLSFEQVNAHVEKHFSTISKVPKSAKTVSIDKLKSIYVVVRPILQLLVNFPFIPSKWKTVITQFMSTLDLLTGQV